MDQVNSNGEEPVVSISRLKELFSGISTPTAGLCGTMVLFWVIGLLSSNATSVLALIPAKYDFNCFLLAFAKRVGLLETFIFGTYLLEAYFINRPKSLRFSIFFNFRR
jgi:hypothetical protein